jgi:hypothetical protein
MGLAIDPEWVPRGYANFSPSSVETLATPDTGIGWAAARALGANTAVITPRVNALYFTTDGSTTPDATHGGYIPVGVTRSFANMATALSNMQIVQDTGATIVHLEWYQAPGG